jgi:uncharacterized protein YbjT (DUF2867 family)
MRIAILGATGQIGSGLTEQLRKDYPHAEIIACARSFSAEKQAFFTSIDASILPFNPFESDWRCLQNLDVLINCIGIIQETPGISFKKIHQDLTNLILDNRQHMGMPRVIQLSALGAGENSPSQFMKTKALADKALSAHTGTLIIRPSIVCTPGTMLIQKLRKLNRLCRFTGGYLPVPAKVLTTAIQPVASHDLYELISLCCRQECNKGIIEVAGKEVFSMRALIGMLPNCRHIVPIPQHLFNAFYFLFGCFIKALLTKEQKQLLLTDNTSNSPLASQLLGRIMAPTSHFWKSEVSAQPLLVSRQLFLLKTLHPKPESI